LNDVHLSEYPVKIIFGRKFNIARTPRVPVTVSAGGQASREGNEARGAEQGIENVFLHDKREG
jgi:hypothetical protein